MSYLLQKLGTILLIASVGILFMKEMLLCYLFLIAVLAIDGWLVYKDEPTITKWSRLQLPKRTDTIITIALIVLFIWAHNPIVGLYFLMGTINGHLNGDW